VVPRDGEEADGVQKTSTSLIVWSMRSKASWNGVEEWPEKLQAAVVFGQVWMRRFAAK
jgi:hypothetical protein